MRKGTKQQLVASVCCAIIVTLTSCTESPQQWFDRVTGRAAAAVTAIPGQTTSNPVLTPRDAIVHGRVTDQTGQPLQRTELQFQVKTPNIPLAAIPTFTDSQGNYERGLEPASYHVTVDVSGYISQTQRITLAGGQIKRIDFVLQPAPTPTSMP
jgi:hypothetical protein